MIDCNVFQALRAANFVRSAVRFRAALWDKTLQPEIFHLNPAVSDNDFFRNVIKYEYICSYSSIKYK